MARTGQVAIPVKASAKDDGQRMLVHEIVDGQTNPADKFSLQIQSTNPAKEGCIGWNQGGHINSSCAV